VSYARFVVAVTVAVGASIPSPAAAQAMAAYRTTVVHVDVDGTSRTYRLHAPVRAGSARPLVVVLHGAGATAKEVERRYHWDPLAERLRFTVVYPQGVGRRWDDSGTRDVDFLRTVVDDVSARTTIDPRRVFVTGISNGGVMAYRAGCGLAGTVAAIAPVAAWFPDCLPATPVSVLHIHGLEDEILSFDGGSGTPPVPTGLAAWRDADGCTGPAAISRAGEITHSVWAECPPGVAVELYTITHGRHEWPGAIPKPGNDPVSHAMDATATIWAFFDGHPRP
jgi:polyhydroxybutyrate depolymerase